MLYRARPSGSPLMNSPNHMPKYEGILFNGNAPNGPNPIAINSVSSSNTALKMSDQNVLSSSAPQQQQPVENDEFANTNGVMKNGKISKDSTPAQLVQWLNKCRLGQHVAAFASFSGSDLLRMSKDDLIQICGLPDGIRLYNTLHTKYVAFEFITGAFSVGPREIIRLSLLFSQSNCTTFNHLCEFRWQQFPCHLFACQHNYRASAENVQFARIHRLFEQWTWE